ncbi:DNA polymerase I [Candidatus Liberibacter americanus]|uniref:DNA polymerase I n=1 Tax=Candidatus Liberibacter americanus str. Sao Paulo TaxID=1261131 RepID=U6B909_9HYPH|nr:DNA polymerase I [Candidatus Liberibacter americanus]AHA28202.1 DNA polymerase I - 3'-5' exonuclease [Candidatus Liberibacter americanus str. Sao Paulo]EMS36284.1 DNA polymerase I [Candidatus Liberibacter americanus PW_SP]
MQKENKHIFLVDGSSFIYKAFYATPPLYRKLDGLPVNAISGFCNMLWKLLQNSRIENTASHFAVVFDHSGKTFRNDIYPEYKANRSQIPEMLIPQLPIVRLATKAFGIQSIELKGFEADDIIATYAILAEKEGFLVTIISTDKDLMQLISPNICMYDTINEEKIDVESVIKKWNVKPEQMVCLQALAGDPSDNIPGAPGIGYKTAISLLQEYKNVDNIIKNANQIKQKKRRESILNNIDIVLTSRNLVKLRTDVQISIPIDNLILEDKNGPKIISFLKALEFTKLINRVAKACDCNANNIDPLFIDIDFVPNKAIAGKYKNYNDDIISGKLEGSISKNSTKNLFLERYKILSKSNIEYNAYIKIIDIEDIKKWIGILKKSNIVSFKIITDIIDAFNSKPIAISFSILDNYPSYSKEENITIYIPLNFRKEKYSIEDVLSHLKDLFENEKILKIGHNIKYDKLVLHRYGITINGFDDIMIMSYVLNSSKSSHDLQYIANKWLSYNIMKRKDILGSRKSFIPIDEINDLQIQEYAKNNSYVILKLWLLLKAKLISERLLCVYERLDKPIINVVAQMEIEGIKIDKKLLLDLSYELSKDLSVLEEKIYNESGEKFNIASPKQLGDILFEKLKLPGGNKTKTGQWKTKAEDIEQINYGNSPLIPYILEWRQISKIKSTYSDSLPHHINNKTNRIHTFYSIASTTTGRLSSLEPNLQNIPIKSDLGKKIRKSFIASPGKKLVSADYNQIELRILAHIAQINPLCKAFEKSLDIHTVTASEIFGISSDKVSQDMRRRAKTINFSIIYGISPFMLAKQLKITRHEAADYINRYFNRFPGIYEYIENTKNFVRENSFVETIFGRRIYYEDINSPKKSIRSISERAAVNAPIQGSAADITRRAMIKVQKLFDLHNLSTKMLLQIHDELLFEATEEEIEQASNIIMQSMKNACLPRIKLMVPLKVDIKIADNWQGMN